MSPFQFSLESVLKIRIEKREARLQELGTAIREWEQIKRDQREILAERDELNRYLKEKSQPGQIDIGLVSRCQLHLAQLGQRNQQSLLQIDQAWEVVQQHRRRYLEADQQVKAIEKIRERRREEHQQKQQRLERLEHEEVLAANTLRNRLP